MSRLVARILLSMFMFPLAVMVYALTMAITEQTYRSSYNPGGYTNYETREEMMFLTADLVTWLAVAIYWCLLWRTSIRWSGGRIGGTVGAALGAVVVGGGVSAVIIGALNRGSSDNGSPILFLGGVLSILLWLFATIFIWRETAAERAARVGASGASSVACPTCGYNLTGLREARCPECGSKFTLDELLAAQPARAAAVDLG